LIESPVNLKADKVYLNSCRFLLHNPISLLTGTAQKVVAPAVAGQLKSTDAPEGTSLTLECYLSGTPYPTVTWYKDGVALTDGPDYVITVGNNSGEPCTLRIRRLNRELHSGVYSIKAVNPGGEASSSATVSVISK
jgi:titin